MEKSIEGVFKEISDALGLEKNLVHGEEGQPMTAVYDVSAMISKILALAVYSGTTVHACFPLLLNQVHADVEWWKIRLAVMPGKSLAGESTAIEPPDQPPSEASPGA